MVDTISQTWMSAVMMGSMIGSCVGVFFGVIATNLFLKR